MPARFTVQPCQVRRVGIGFGKVIHVQAQVIAQYICIGQLIHLRLKLVVVFRLPVYGKFVFFEQVFILRNPLCERTRI